MPNLARFTAFAAGVGVVAPACSTCSTVALGMVLQENYSINNGVAPVAPVAPANSDIVNEIELWHAYEHRAAIMEYDGGLDRHEAEALAWFEVFGDRERDSVNSR